MDYAAIILAIGGVLGTLVGVWAKHLYDSRKLTREECNLDDDRADKSYQVVIAEFRARITALEEEVRALRKAYDSEVRTSERLKAQIEILERKQQNN